MACPTSEAPLVFANRVATSSLTSTSDWAPAAGAKTGSKAAIATINRMCDLLARRVPRTRDQTPFLAIRRDFLETLRGADFFAAPFRTSGANAQTSARKQVSHLGFLARQIARP